MSRPQATFAEKQKRANRIEGQFDTLKDQIADAYSDKDVAAMHAEMALLSSQYLELTDLSLD